MSGTGDNPTSEPPAVPWGEVGDTPASPPVPITDDIAKRDAVLREWMAKTVVPTFIWANGIALAVLVVLAVVDEINLVERLAPSADRIINHQVVMALLGATTVQVGAIAAIIARYLFQHRPTPAAQRVTRRPTNRRSAQ
jgi:hypothetical protein